MIQNSPQHPVMRAWLGLGDWIGAHLMLIVPAGVAIGISFPQLLLPVKPAIPTLFALMTLQNSLGNDPRALRETIAKPLPLICVICWVHLIAPLVTRTAASLVFGPDSPTMAGVVLEYSVPIGASTIMWVGMFSGEIALGLTTLLTSTLISPFTIPLTLKLLVGATIAFDPFSMMGNMIYMVALPALLATIAYALTSGKSAELSRPTMPFSRILLPLIVATNATALSDYARHPSWHLLGIMAFMLCFAIASFLVGMTIARRLAGRRRDRFVTLSFCCGIRNVSVGAVLATQYFGPEVMFPAIIGTPFQQFLAALFGHIMERALERGEQGTG